jgi:hypothetical protein
MIWTFSLSPSPLSNEYGKVRVIGGRNSTLLIVVVFGREEMEDFPVGALQWIALCAEFVEGEAAVFGVEVELLRHAVVIASRLLTLGDLRRATSLVAKVTPKLLQDILNVAGEKLQETIVREFISYREYLVRAKSFEILKLKFSFL